MSIVPVKYPLDLTGQAPTNKVIEEAHQLPQANIRVLVMRNGAYFTDSLEITDAANGRVLTKGVDYHPALLYPMPTQQTGHAVHQIVVIVDRTVSSNVLVTAQMLGGEYSYSYDAIVQLVHELDLDNRPILFDMIVGKPSAWNPSPHLHDMGDVYGFEYHVAALERIRQAIMLGSAPSTKAIYDYLNNQLLEVNNRVDIIQAGQNTPESIIAALGFPPMDSNGGEFKGPVKLSKGFASRGFYKEHIERLTATSSTTILDLSLATIFDVTLSASTLFKFDLTHVPDMSDTESLSFTLIIRNDDTAGRAVAFENTVDWADKSIPPRTTAARGKDEFYFSSFNGGVRFTGSLSNVNVGQAIT